MIQSILAALFYALQNASNKLFSGRFKSGLYQLAAFNALALSIGTGFVYLLNRPAMISPLAMGFALLFGVLFAATLSMIVVTYSMGPMALSSMIVDMNVIITVLLSAVLWKEKITFVQGVGIVVMLAVIVLLSMPEEKESAKAHRRWLVTVLTTMCINGLLNITQTATFKTCTELSASDFTFWSIAMSALVCIVMAIVLKLTTHARFGADEPMKKLLVYASGVGVGTAVAYHFHNQALFILPSLIVFPLVTGLANVFLMLTSILFMGEKPTPRKLILFVVGIGGILMMNF